MSSWQAGFSSGDEEDEHVCANALTYRFVSRCGTHDGQSTLLHQIVSDVSSDSDEDDGQPRASASRDVTLTNVYLGALASLNKSQSAAPSFLEVEKPVS
jgi:hypothetical protein